MTSPNRTHGPRNFVGHNTTGKNMPDQTHSAMFLQDMIEARAWQNKLKNNLRKQLFQFDKGNSALIAVISLCR